MANIHFTELASSFPICRDWKTGDVTVSSAKSVTCKECKSYYDGKVFAPETVHLAGDTVYVLPRCGNSKGKEIVGDINFVTCMKCINERAHSKTI